MVTVIGVRFKKAGKVYYFDPSDVWPKPGEYVVVETARGIEMGEVVTSAREVEDEQIVAPLKKVVRMAVEEDIRRMEYNESREKEAYHMAQERIAHHKLDMKLVDVEYTFDNSKIIFYFTANGRVDFRELVKDLASVFKMRIELRQIGVRDEAKMLGGLGSCGRTICCAQFLGDFQPVSIKMAKEQNLSLNPTKISGQCGRLMCCLKYEQDYYEASLKRLPKVGRECVTPDGIGIITDINVIREKVRVRVRTPEDTIDVREYSLEEVSKPSQAHAAQHGEAQRATGDGTRAPRQEGTAKKAGGRKENGEREAQSSKQREPKLSKERTEREQKIAQQQVELLEKQERQRERRIASRKKSKQLSTDQFLDKLKFESTERHGVRLTNAEARRRGTADSNPPQKPASPGTPSGWGTVPKPGGKSVKPGDPMNS